MRAGLWISLAVVGASSAKAWGIEKAVGKGPPMQWERLVVGCALLLLVAAVLLMFSGRKGKALQWPGLATGVACTLGAAFIALHIRSEAIGNDTPALLQGGGFSYLWLGASIGLAAQLAAVLSKFTSQTKAKDKPPRSVAKKPKKSNKRGRNR